MTAPGHATPGGVSPPHPIAAVWRMPAAPVPVAEAAAAAVWRVRLLGGFEIDDGRRRLTRLRSRASMALLARLAMEPGRDHARDELATLLWPEASEERGRSRLRQTLSLLRAVLEPAGTPPVLQADRWVLRVRPGALWCDVRAFESALAQRELVAARALYRGELLPGLVNEWLEDERRRLAARAEGLAALGPAPAPRAPLHVVPLAATRRDREDPFERPADGMVDVPVTARPPVPGDAVFGLDAALEGLHRRMADRRLITVVGPGGIGKTRLVVQACGTPVPTGPVRFVDVGGLRSAGQLLRRLRAVLRVPGGPLGLERLADRLGPAPGTLVLDGCEALDDDARGLLAAALQRLPALRCVITSRCPLGLPGEHLLRLAPLPLPQPTGDADTGADTDTDANAGAGADAGLAALASQPAMALFVDRARGVRPEFRLHRGNAGALVALLHHLDGWPLAIELAAAQMRLTNPAMLLAGFAPTASLAGGADDGLALLARRGARTAADARHANLAAVLDDSLQLLDDASLALLRRLAAHAGDVSMAEAHAMAGPDSAGRQRLATLLDHGWLQPVDALGGPPAYRLGSLVRRRLAGLAPWPGGIGRSAPDGPRV